MDGDRDRGSAHHASGLTPASQKPVVSFEGWIENANAQLEDAMVAWDRVTAADVRRAMKEYDRLGPERFFSEHGFARPRLMN